MFRRMWSAVSSALAFVLVMIATLGLAALSVVFVFLPKARKEERERLKKEADELAANVKAEVQKAHEARAAEVEVRVETIEKKAEAQKARDSVDVANQFIMGKKS